jgi:hypothetical protein
MRVNKHIIERKVTRNQQKATAKNIEVEEDNLENCNIGNNIMNMNNKATAIPCIMNGNSLQNEIVGSKGSRQSTRSKKVSTSRNKDFLWEI